MNREQDALNVACLDDASARPTCCRSGWDSDDLPHALALELCLSRPRSTSFAPPSASDWRDPRGMASMDVASPAF